MRTWGVIIARGNNKGLPDKHLRLLCGQPLIVYSIQAARQARLLNELMLSTDDQRIAALAEQHAVKVISRPAELADDTATVDAAVRQAVKTRETSTSPPPKIVVILYGNIPIRPAGLIDQAIEHLIQSGADSVQSYSPVGKMHPDWMVQLAGDRVIPNCSQAIYRRQDLRAMFIPNGAVIAVRYKSLFRQPAGPEDHHAFLGQDRRGFVPPQAEFIVDVDTLNDLLLAEAISNNSSHLDLKQE